MPLMIVSLFAAVPFATDPAATAPPPVEQAAPAAAQRYCVEDVITGSRIPVRECHTRADWLKLGFDPLNPDA